MLKSKHYVLDSAVVEAKFTLHVSLGHAEHVDGINNFDSISVGYSLILFLGCTRWLFELLALVFIHPW